MCEGGGGGEWPAGGGLVISKNVTRRSGYLDRDAAACPCPCSTVRVKFCGKMHSCASNSESDGAQPRLQQSVGKEHKDSQTDRQTHVLTCVGSASAAAHPHIRIWRSGVDAAGNILFCERNETWQGGGGAGRGWVCVCVSLLRNILSVAQPSCQAQSVALPPPVAPLSARHDCYLTLLLAAAVAAVGDVARKY